MIDSSSSSSSTLDDLRQKGNYEFQKGNLDNAVIFYTSAIEQAIETKENQALIINCCNRSACYFQMEEFEQAKEDAVLAWQQSNKSNVKAAYRLSKTLLALNDFKTAMETLKDALSIESLQEKEIQSLQELLKQAKEKYGRPNPEKETTIKDVDRPVSIREFHKSKTIGYVQKSSSNSALLDKAMNGLA